jgi:hypothetical protein
VQAGSVSASQNRVGHFGVPKPVVRYPSFKSLDKYIDIRLLRSLDPFMSTVIARHARADRDSFFLNQHRLETDSPYVPGVREIWLTRTRPGTPYDYLDINHTALWQNTEAAEEFRPLMDFIDTLPFESKGRILIIYDAGGHAVPAHRDHEREDICHEFIWFRTNLSKPLYMLNHLTGEKLSVDSYTAWFDTVNQYHGSDATGQLSFSVRVDGRFTDEFRSRIPFSLENPASTPSVWAMQDGEARA